MAADVGRARTLATQAVHLSERVRCVGGCRGWARRRCRPPLPPDARAAVGQAIALKPDNPRAHLASAVALARLAMYCPNQKKIEITKTVRERVITCLSLSPDDDVALHVLGRWEYEMVCVGFAVRLLLKVVYGGLKVGSLDAAHRCLARAIELRPDRLVHRVVMARILLKQGRQPEAVDELRTALRSRVEDINAVHERREATDMLRRLGVQLPGVDADTPLGSPRPASPPPAGAQPLTLESPLVMRRCSWSVEALPEAVPFDFAFPPPPGFEPEAADG